MLASGDDRIGRALDDNTLSDRRAIVVCRSGPSPAICCAVPSGATGRHPAQSLAIVGATTASAAPDRGVAGAFSRGGETDCRTPSTIRRRPCTHDLARWSLLARRTIASARNRSRFNFPDCASNREQHQRRFPLDPGRYKSNSPGSTGMPKCTISPPAPHDPGPWPETSRGDPGPRRRRR